MIVYDLISLAPVIATVYSLIKKEYKMLFGIIVVTIIQLLIKKGIKNFKIKNEVFLRPKDACNCSSMNNGGHVGLTPGFPSGHVAVTTFFVNYMYFKYYTGDYFILTFINIVPLIMGISRYEKQCHNIWQILAGYTLAIIVLMFF